MTTLTFQNTAMTVINQKNQTFFTATDLGRALEYSDADRSVRRLYTANADEFTPEMTALVEMQTNGGKQQVRIFSLRGAHLIAMFARTKVAKEFRKWVLDILDREVSQKTAEIRPLALPEPPKMYPRELTEKEMQDWCWAWYALRNYIELTDKLQKQFGGFGGDYARAIRQLNERYGNLPQDILPTLQRITKEFNPDNLHGNGWNRIIYNVRHPHAIIRSGSLVHLF